ncbi:MAG: hypothetical protein LBG77_02880 [Dysgonamonadaceae bacterium]|jgi:polygalacturonase|nr:hypothetical protein [Dysgonamonadaceae bacterium]
MKANALFSKNGRIAADGTSNTYLQTNHVNRMTILNANGYVGIGTTNPHKELDVNGIVRAKEVKVETVPSLAEVKNHIETNKHLPGISTEVEVKENGVNLGEMQTKLLQKIEELTLYLIQQNEEIKNLKVELDNLKSNK